MRMVTTVPRICVHADVSSDTMERKRLNSPSATEQSVSSPECVTISGQLESVATEEQSLL